MEIYNFLQMIATIFMIYLCVYSLVNRLCECAEKCAKQEELNNVESRDEKTTERTEEK